MKNDGIFSKEGFIYVQEYDNYGGYKWRYTLEVDSVRHIVHANHTMSWTLACTGKITHGKALLDDAITLNNNLCPECYTLYRFGMDCLHVRK